MRLSQLKGALEKRGLSTEGSKETLESRLQNALNEPNPLQFPSPAAAAAAGPDWAKPMGSAFTFGTPLAPAASRLPPPPPPVADPTPTLVMTPKLEVTLSSSSDDIMEVGSSGGASLNGDEAAAAGLMYPPRQDYLPFDKAAAAGKGQLRRPFPANKPSIMSRISGGGGFGIEKSGGGNILDRLSAPRGRSIAERLGGPSSIADRLGPSRYQEESMVEIHRPENDDTYSDQFGVGGGGAEEAEDEVFNEEHRAMRAKRFRNNNPLQTKGVIGGLGGGGGGDGGGGQVSSKSKKSIAASVPDLIEVYQEYDLDLMKERADKYSDVPSLKRRARRFDEETANELVQVKEARAKNQRFKRFKLGDESSSSSSSSSDEED